MIIYRWWKVRIYSIYYGKIYIKVKAANKEEALTLAKERTDFVYLIEEPTTDPE